jgi:alanine racemase
MLYGVSPLRRGADGLRPALSWRARVAQVRDLPAGAGISYGRSFVTAAPTRVATVAVGYGDGYPRSLSGAAAEVLVAGRRCPLLGRVTMDMIMVDVTALPNPPRPGEIVTLLGPDGDEAIDATEIAAKAGTIPWEVLTGIAPRVKRLVRTAPEPRRGTG